MSSNLETPTPSGSQIPAWARERAEMLQGLYIHMMVFILMNAGLFFINWATRGDDGTWWFLWVLVIWGVGFLIHVAVTVTPVFRSDWVERKAERIAGQH
jgi:hypothetical protein